jgi:hypothetical protein
MAIWLTQPLTEMRTRNISWGCVGSLNLLEPSGPLKACNGIALPLLLTKGRHRSVGIATRYGMDVPGIESRWGRDFPHPSRPALGPTQPPIKSVLGHLPGVKATGTWRWPPTQSSAELKERVELHLFSPSGPSCHVRG